MQYNQGDDDLYNLSIYGINFIGRPALSRYRLRVINQQTFAFAETRPFTAYENIVYPIHLTIAGADTMLLKIKVQELLPHKEVAIGEGILNIGTRNTNCSLRTIVYDCAFALQEVAICSVDIFVGSYTLKPGEDHSYQQLAVVQEDDNEAKSQDEREHYNLMETFVEEGHESSVEIDRITEGVQRFELDQGLEEDDRQEAFQKHYDKQELSEGEGRKGLGQQLQKETGESNRQQTRIEVRNQDSPQLKIIPPTNNNGIIIPPINNNGTARDAIQADRGNAVKDQTRKLEADLRKQYREQKSSEHAITQNWLKVGTWTDHKHQGKLHNKEGKHQRRDEESLSLGQRKLIYQRQSGHLEDRDRKTVQDKQKKGAGEAEKKMMEETQRKQGGKDNQRKWLGGRQLERKLLEGKESSRRTMGGEEVDNKLVDQVLTNESLLEKIRRHLASADFRKDVRSPGKVRRKQYTVDEAHSPLASHVQYHSDFEGQGYYLIRNIRFYRIVFNELKDDSKDEVTENKMSKIVFSLNSLPIVTVDMAGTQSDLAVKLPLHNATVEVQVQLPNSERMTGTIGMQEGSDMVVNLDRAPRSYVPILQRESYKLKFDIQPQSSLLTIMHEQKDEKASDDRYSTKSQQHNILARVAQRAMQPWSFIARHASFNAGEGYESLRDMTRNKPNPYLGLTEAESLRKSADSGMPRDLSAKQKVDMSAKEKVVQAKGNEEGQMLKINRLKVNLPKINMKPSSQPEELPREKLYESLIRDNQGRLASEHHKDKRQYDPESFLSEKESRFFSKQFGSQNERDTDHERARPRRRKKTKDSHKKSASITNSSPIDEVESRNRNSSHLSREDRRHPSLKHDINPHTMKKLWQKLLLGRKGDKRALQSPKKEPIAINRAVTALRKVDAHRKELKRKKKRSEMEIEKPVLFSLPKDESLLPVSKIQLGRSKAQTLETTLPDRELSLQVKNLSITEEEMVKMIDRKDGESRRQVGKFLKISVPGKATYYTQVILQSAHSSLLWKLEGCYFYKLNEARRLELEVYETKRDEVRLLGSATLQVSELRLMQDNHIFNGTMKPSGTEFTLGFEMKEHLPFQIIDESEEFGSRMKDSTLDRKKLQRKENVSKKSFKDERRYQEEAVQKSRNEKEGGAQRKRESMKKRKFAREEDDEGEQM